MNSAATNSLVILHATVVTPESTIQDGWVRVENGRIAEIGQGLRTVDADKEVSFDANGAYLIPGFIDVHVHGGAGHDFMDADTKVLNEITRFHADHGTTGLLATSLTASREELTGILDRIDGYMKSTKPYARILGVHLEGPFISEKWKGAQNPEHIVPPQIEWLEEWTARFPGTIKIQTLAPENEGALAYIDKLVQHGIVPSCGHTDATYDQIVEAANHGLRHAVHTFNAMRGLHHREPGTVGAVLTDKRIMAEVIADGHHVHPAGIQLVLSAKGADNVILVTDAMAAAGMPDGDYELGGLPVEMSCGVARLKGSGNLAGSTLTMIAAVRYLIQTIGAPIEEVSRMASANPARQLGLIDELGTVETGKRTDLVLLDNTSFDVRNVWIAGSIVKK